MKKRQVETDVSMKEELIYQKAIFPPSKLKTQHSKISFLNKNVVYLPHYATINDSIGCKLSK